MPRFYNSKADVKPAPIRSLPTATKLPPITAATRTVNIKTAVKEIYEHKGLEICDQTIRNYCRSGKWIKGIHWVKHGKSYLINLEAVYQTLSM